MWQKAHGKWPDADGPVFKIYRRDDLKAALHLMEVCTIFPRLCGQLTTKLDGLRSSCGNGCFGNETGTDGGTAATAGAAVPTVD
jgi:hypothetical protein